MTGGAIIANSIEWRDQALSAMGIRVLFFAVCGHNTK
jgi:hypothetical protein